jgi:trypsin
MLVRGKNFEHNFGRIYGGKDAEISDYPFVAAVNFDQNGAGYFCGSSIISEDTLITAAHCLADADEGSVQIIAGSTSWRAGTRDPGAQNIFASKVTFHEGYDANILANDVGIIYLGDNKLTLSNSVNTVSLAAAEPAVGDVVTAIGWGATSSAGGVSNQLHYADDLVIVEDKETTDFFRDEDLPMEMIICSFQGKDGTCGGDSGGPIVDERGQLFGATSFGNVFCETGPSCFSSLPFHKDWLRDNGVPGVPA